MHTAEPIKTVQVLDQNLLLTWDIILLTLDEVLTFTFTAVFPLLYSVLMSPTKNWFIFDPVATSPCTDQNYNQN